MQPQTKPRATSPQTKTVESPTTSVKRPWRRPTVTFTPITSTAINSGSPVDLGTGSGPI